MTPRRILTPKSFENAIIVHAAIGGSLNAVMHLIAIAREAEIELSADTFDRIHREIPVLVDTKTAGHYPTELFWYAGGVPRVMMELREFLHLDQLTVTGLTLDDNLKRYEADGLSPYMEMFLGNYKLNSCDIIYSIHKPLKPEGSVAVLKGSLAPEGSTIKKSAVDKQMLLHQGPVKVYDHEEDGVQAYLNKEIEPGDVVVIRYQGPKACGMPEMFFISELIASDPVLSRTTCLVTDGRFSGATRGPCVGYLGPEAVDGGPIALLENGDIVRIDLPNRCIDIVGILGTPKQESEIEQVLRQRRTTWKKPELAHKGVLGQYCRSVRPALQGGSMN